MKAPRRLRTRHGRALLLVLALCVLLQACGDSPDPADGEASEPATDEVESADRPSGDREGGEETADGEAADGEAADGEATDEQAGFPAAEDCAPFEPAALPSGASPGEGRPFPEDDPNDFMRAYGSGQDEVVVGWGQDLLDEVFLGDSTDFAREDVPDELRITRDGVDRVVMPIGDPPAGQISIRFLVDGCPYGLWMGPGYEVEDAVEYAERF